MSNKPQTEHRHEYDEYMVIVEGAYTLKINGETIHLKAGDEYVTSKGMTHSGISAPGTRITYAFGGKRANRVSERQ